VRRFFPGRIGWMLVSLLLGGVGTVNAEEGKLPAQVAYVDVNNLLENFKDYKEKNAGYKEFVKSRLIKRNQRIYLTEKEWAELDQLQAKDPAKLSDQEKARLHELETLSQTRDKELTDLQALREPTPAQVARRKELNEIVNKNRKKIDALNAKYDQEVKAKEQELLTALKERIRKAVEAVAQEKGLVLVVEKAMLLYGAKSLDITPLVLKRLNTSSE